MKDSQVMEQVQQRLFSAHALTRVGVKYVAGSYSSSTPSNVLTLGYKLVSRPSLSFADDPNVCTVPRRWGLTLGTARVVDIYPWYRPSPTPSSLRCARRQHGTSSSSGSQHRTLRSVNCF